MITGYVVHNVMGRILVQMCLSSHLSQGPVAIFSRKRRNKYVAG
jgi:hypothetical protein